MLRNEVSECLAYTAKLWPRWDAAEAEIGVWRAAMESLNTSLARWRRATDEAYLDSRFLSPRFKDIRDKLRTMPGDGDQEEPTEPFVYIGWWAVRVDRPDQRPLMVKPGCGMSPDACRSIVLAWIEGDDRNPGLRAMYGGQWCAVGPGAADATQARRGLGDPAFEARYQVARRRGYELHHRHAGADACSAADFFAGAVR